MWTEFGRLQYILSTDRKWTRNVFVCINLVSYSYCSTCFLTVLLRVTFVLLCLYTFVWIWCKFQCMKAFPNWELHTRLLGGSCFSITAPNCFFRFYDCIAIKSSGSDKDPTEKQMHKSSWIVKRSFPVTSRCARKISTSGSHGCHINKSSKIYRSNLIFHGLRNDFSIFCESQQMFRVHGKVRLTTSP